jgi:hypothetical protein
MIISHKKKFIFIHIPKTAGNAVSSSLLPYARFIEKISRYYQTKRIISSINKIFNLHDNGNKWINRLHKHTKAITVRDYIGKDIYNDYFKFAFVRNPYDYQVSLYHYVKQANEHKDNKIAQNLSFKEFIYRRLEKRPLRQIDFLINEKGYIIVDYLGHTEKIQENIDFIFNYINIPNNKLPILNRSNRDKNFMYYYDEELKKDVFEYFKKDFESFGYDS